MRFRLQALAHRGEPEELDVVPKLVRPQAAIAVAVLVALVASITVWAFVGNLPRRLSLEGLIVSGRPLNTVQSTVNGFVVELLVGNGDTVETGDGLVTVVDDDGERHTVPSPFDGTAIEIGVAAGEQVREGSPVADVMVGDPDEAGLEVILLVPSEDAAQIAPGMDVNMAVASAPTAAFGLLRGTVETVVPTPLTSDDALRLLGNDLLVEELVAGRPVNPIIVAVERDADTASGYAWTTGDGPPFPVFPQTLITATVRTGNERPIDLVFSN